MSRFVNTGIQQVGIGVPDMESAFRWYARYFGMDIPVFQDAAEAPLMTQYTGNQVQTRAATLAMNIQGGGGFEIWQFTSRNTVPPSFQPQLGDVGIYAVRIKTRNVFKAASRLSQEGLTVINGPTQTPARGQHLVVSDNHGLVFDIVESQSWFVSSSAVTGGVEGALIGVSDMDRSVAFYRDVLGYDTVIADSEGVFQDLTGLAGGNKPLRRVLLGHSGTPRGAFARLIGSSHLELVQSLDRAPEKLFDGRYWGDLGFIHLCFDVRGMDALKEHCEAAGHPFTVDSGATFDMGEAGGRFSYVEDPDGTLIEFVETHKLPLVKALGWSLDLSKRDPEKPLPNFMLKLLALGRVKNP